MKTICLIFTSFLFFNFAQAYEIHCAKRFLPVLEKIQALPEGQALIEKALEEGDIQIRANQSNPKAFEGYWNLGNRTIYLTVSNHTKEANLISTLVFELHNATRTKDFHHLDRLARQGHLHKKAYIRENEFIEYENVIATANILDKGRRLGIFPPECRWVYNDNFEDHFWVQKQCGHSAYIGKSYDYLCF